MAITHDPAQVTLTFADLVKAVKIETQIADVGVQLTEVIPQLCQALNFVQRIGEMNVVAVQLAEAMQVVFVQPGKLAGEAAQEFTHRCRPQVGATAGS